MFRYLLGFRANVAILFFGAFAVMVLIKLTAYLPGKYYFSFSRLFAGASEPFVVDPPSVTGAKLCALMSRHNLSSSDIGQHVDCKAQSASGGGQVAYGAALFEKNEIDRIYSTALTADSSMRTALTQYGRQIAPPAISGSELDEILRTAGSVNEAYRSIWNRYELALSGNVDAVMKNGTAALFANVRARDVAGTPQDPSENQPKLKGLSSDESAAIRRAYAAFVSALGSQNLGAAATPLTKSSVDSIIDKAYGAESIPIGVTQHYRDAIAAHTQGVLRAKFAEAGVAPVEQQAAKRIIFEELVKDGLVNYVIASTIRLLPVLLVGLALGLYFGRSELFSTSLAGAFAAFLLTWPIMLMWDRVVQSTWHDKKLIFLAFYGVYITSFFLTARIGALIGIRMREGAPERITSIIDRETGSASVKGASWVELAGNICVGLLANAAVAAWNVIIPLNAS